MKSFIVILILASSFHALFSQNIIQNGSFEIFYNGTNFPNPSSIHSLLDSFPNWSSSIGSCDVLSGKYPYSSYMSTPKSPKGYQIPRTGTNYAGAGYASQVSYPNIPHAGQEIPQAHLSSPLIQNQTYKVRAYITSAGWRGFGNYLALDSFGFIFSDTAYNSSMFQQYPDNPMPFPPDVVDTINYYSDTTKWYEISGEYTAQGGEEYLIMGYFLSTASYPNLPMLYNTYASLYEHSQYSFFDDVAVWPADTTPPPADAGSDTTICRGGKARLGTHNYADYIYEWWPAATLSNDSGGVVWASPDTTTTYYLRATDDIFTKTMDSVTVYVTNCGQNDTVVCVEQQFQMGSTNNPLWNYQWSPPTWLSSDTVGMPLCNPMANQDYQLLITTASGDTIALDSTHLVVGSCYYAEAGTDSLICKGDTLQIGMQHYGFIDYHWSPNYMISDTTIGNPVVWPDTSIYYYLQVVDTMGNISYDSVYVGVHICLGINGAIPFEDGFWVYPNPAAGLLKIGLRNSKKKIVKIRLINLLGQSVLEVSGINSYKALINTSNLNKGTYLIEVISDNDNYVQKLIIR